VVADFRGLPKIGRRERAVLRHMLERGISLAGTRAVLGPPAGCSGLMAWARAGPCARVRIVLGRP